MRFRIAVALLLFAPAAYADNGALAEELFPEGCAKLAESERLEPAGGTLLTLGLCHEREGRTASAWGELTDAIAYAKRDGRGDRQQIAEEHSKALEPRLIRLRLQIAKATPALKIALDGAELGRGAWDAAAPVDPGKHTIAARASGYRDFTMTVDAHVEGAVLEVAIPELEPLQPVTPPPPFNGVRFAAYMVGSVAVIATGAGLYLGLDALENKNRAKALCPAHTCKDAVAVEASRSAGHSADLATGAFVIGAATFAVAITLYLLSPDRPAGARGFNDVYRF
jgi:hypothetical protein